MIRVGYNTDLYDYGEGQDYVPDNDDDGCEGCGRNEYDSGCCPMCCSSGSFAPGTEICDLCDYYNECSDDLLAE